MTIEINFYCIDGEITKFIHNFLLQVTEKGNKVLIHSESEEKVNKLDDDLWTIGHVNFLAHSTKEDEYVKDQPVFISTNKNNPSDANFLLISNFLDDEDFLSQFEKIFYVFTDINPQVYKKAEDSWQKYKEKNYSLKCIKKDKTGKWKETSNFTEVENTLL